MNEIHTEYGIEKLARLKKVLLHNPVESLPSVTEGNYKYHLFNNVPKVDQYIMEHEQYAQLLRAHGVQVLEVRNYVQKTKDLLSKLPNLAYLHDVAVVTSKGAILSEMCPGTRAGEEEVVKEVLTNLGIPIFHEFEDHDQFEGCLVLSPDTLIIVDTERLNPDTIEGFFEKALEIFKEVIYIKAPQARRFMHGDMIFNRISENLGVYFPPAFLETYLISKERREEIDMRKFLESKNMELIELSDVEQQNWGCSFVPLEPNVIIHYDISLSNQTKKQLQQRGVQIIEFHPQALLAGGGSLLCLTLRLWRA
ncbi:N-dimethylarginine dimethylaminohydrolase [Desulfosporosinus orientis DSM 765]|uniref:N-dimethylarginine dimethylaminohydrolase n=1 Tax=Desulfosporosinus orientis (strain ATCC 19365 / DSM 765 / NCIMB 8382 / VKM B-1628 / Singapore I) TaxID=768706 RepID=G7WFW9_DESOD|nr:arginine deiminase family protein [Desulfosporosinus orientis]AET69484.1 N-dimethylarginine dimethylaminohydrolase [Desulfosporosinus orientis DSM 765]